MMNNTQLLHSTQQLHPKNLSRFSGFSLIELMIAMVIGLLMVTTVVQIFAGISRSNSDMASTNDQIDNARFSLLIIENDVVHGGFWGGYVPQFDNLAYTSAPTDIPVAVPNPCLAYADWDATVKTGLIGVPVQAYDAVPGGCDAVITNKKAGTDVLVVRHADTCVTGSAGCEADTTATASPKVYFQPQFCGTAITTEFEYVLAASNTLATFNKQKRDCVTTASKYKYVANIYYIRDDNVLMRAEFGGGGGTAWSSQPLIEGVEGFAVELGIDSISDAGVNIITGVTMPYTQAITLNATKTSASNRGDGTPDYYKRCTAASPCSVPELVNTVAVKLHLLVRGSAPTAGYRDTKTYTLGGTAIPAFNDGYKRHVYSTAVRLRNVSGRRETP